MACTAQRDDLKLLYKQRASRVIGVTFGHLPFHDIVTHNYDVTFIVVT